MAKVHFLNVNQGDCILLEHNSGRLTMFDVCAGNIPRQTIVKALEKAMSPARGNFRMCENPTNPIDYLRTMGVSEIWRFILSHPDMDHLDGFDAVMDEFSVLNFWNSGVERTKPDFSTDTRYQEADWDRYANVISGKEQGTECLVKCAGAKFKYANDDDSSGVGDALRILAPDKELVYRANKTQDFNDASYIVLYRSAAGKVLLSGDAHDATWEYVLDNYEDDVRNVTLLIAPHHGRKSGRSYEFLKVVNPKLTLFGCAPSEHLAYDAWNNRNLNHITNNQCGCVVAEWANDQMEIYVENEMFAAKSGGNTNVKNAQGFFYLGAI